MHPLRPVILAAARHDGMRRLVGSAPVTRDVVRRFVAGERAADVVATVAALAADGLTSTLDYLGEDTDDRALAEQTVLAYLEVLDRLQDGGLVAVAEVSVKLSAIGRAVDPGLALDNAARICAAAEQAGTTVTVDMEDHTTTDVTLEIVHELRRSWPSVGAVLQAYLRRTLSDCQALTGAGSRVRLCKGAYAEPSSVAFAPHEADLNYVRCTNELLAGEGFPMFATHDPRLVEIVSERAKWHGRAPDSYEHQMLFGVRSAEQRRLAADGATVRVYLPYGSDWYGYLMRRLAERPANTAFFARALLGSGPDSIRRHLAAWGV